ncbi:MAG: hypothetical protein Q9207_002863 [Kuettlingeria erythrocarpa]
MAVTWNVRRPQGSRGTRLMELDRYSYTYIENSVRNGTLEDLEKHAAGPPIGTLRQVGSTIQLPKSSRTKFTSDDDRILVNWVVGMEQSGGATSGNKIYKQLEAKNPRHTWQSWRDRWVKNLKDLPRSAYMSQGAPPTPPAEHSVENRKPLGPAIPQKMGPKPFSKVDAEDLIANGQSLREVLLENVDEAWLAGANSRHVRQDLRENGVRPVDLKRIAESTSGLSETQATAKPITTREEPAEQQETTTLPVRTSPSKPLLVERNVPASPKSPTDYSETAPTGELSKNPVIESVDGTSDARRTARSPLKRKRLTSEEVEEVPSSSPPEKVKSPKRLRSNDMQAPINALKSSPLHAEVESTVREVPDTYAVDTPAKAHTADPCDYIEIEDDSSEHMYEEDYDSDAPYPVSPELGRSPSKTINDTQRNVSETQAAFDQAIPDIDFGLALPEGGFGDEEEMENDGTPRAELEIEDQDSEDEIFHSLEANEEDEQDSFHSTTHPLPANSSPSPGSDFGPDSIPPSSPPLPISPNYTNSTTQALLNAETQQPDYSLPGPEGGWPPELFPPSSQSDNSPSSSLNILPSSQPEPHKQALPTIRTPSPNPADQIDDFIDRHISLGYTDDAIHTALKCTNLDPDLSVKVLQVMKANKGRVPKDMRGCWTEEDDQDLESVDARRIRRLEEKHGKGALEARWAWLEDYRRDDGPSGKGEEEEV